MVMFSVMSVGQSVIPVCIQLKCRFVFFVLNKNLLNIVVYIVYIEWTFHLKSSFHYVVKFIRHHLISSLMILLLCISKMSLFYGHNSGLHQL